MTTFVEIENGIARVVERVVNFEGALADVMPLIETRKPITLPILPRNPVRSAFYEETDANEKRLELMIEVAPHVRTLDLRDGAADPNLPCRVALPHTIFYFLWTTNHPDPQGNHWSLDNERVYFSAEPLNNLDQWLVPAVLPNVYRDGQICYGNTGVNTMQPLAMRTDEMVNSFYLTGFTDHHVRTNDWPWNRRTYKKWARETAKDEKCWKNFPEFDRNDPAYAHIERIQAKDVFSTVPDRTEQIVLPDGIPPLRFTPTFGRAEQWVMEELTATQRQRLLVALQNRQAEEPDAFATTATPVIADDDEDDD